MNNTSYKNYKEFYHDCPSKKCMGNFFGTCRQPFVRCERNVDIAFEALQENQELLQENQELKKFKESFLKLYGHGYIIKYGYDGACMRLDTFIDAILDNDDISESLTRKNPLKEVKTAKVITRTINKP